MKTVKDHTYRMKPENLNLLNKLEFNVNMGKSPLMNLSLVVMSVTLKELCLQNNCFTQDAARMLCESMEDESSLDMIASIYGLDPTAVDANTGCRI